MVFKSKHRICYEIAYKIVRNWDLINFDDYINKDPLGYRYLCSEVLLLNEMIKKGKKLNDR